MPKEKVVQANNNISIATFQRVPVYIKALQAMKDDGIKYASSVLIAERVKENPSVVKKDLSFAIKTQGIPKLGYKINKLIFELEDYLGYYEVKNAVLIGIGQLGHALLNYEGFDKYGLKIVAGFDVDENLIGKSVNGIRIYPLNCFSEVINQTNTKIGILSIPKNYAQQTADILVDSGIRAIWNFTPSHIDVPNSVTVKNEDLASSLAILSRNLKDMLENEEN